MMPNEPDHPVAILHAEEIIEHDELVLGGLDLAQIAGPASQDGWRSEGVRGPNGLLRVGLAHLFANRFHRESLLEQDVRDLAPRAAARQLALEPGPRGGIEGAFTGHGAKCRDRAV